MAFQLTDFQLLDDNGDPLSGGKVTVYEAGTTSLKNSYPTANDADAGTNANANPVILDSAGRGQIWGQSGEAYKVKITDSADVVQETIDDITGPNSEQTPLGYYVAGGTANAQTVSADPGWSSYLTGSVMSIKPVADNTGAVTLNVNGLGAKSIKLVEGADPYPGALDASGIHIVQYDGTNLVLINPATITGSYTATGTGFSGTAPEATVYYTRVGNIVTVMSEDNPSATSNATSMTFTGAPASIRPTASTGNGALLGVNNGSNQVFFVKMQSTGALEFSTTGGVNGFTASGAKGFFLFTYTYLLR